MPEANSLRVEDCFPKTRNEEHKQKPPVHNGTGGSHSRGTTQISHPRRLRLVTLFVLTNISLPCNVGNTAQTTRSHSLARLERELQLDSVEHGFQPMPRASLTTSASLLSSVIAFYWGRLLSFIICKNGGLSRPNIFAQPIRVALLLLAKLYQEPEAP